MHDLGHGADLLGEAIEPLLRVIAGLDRHEDRDAEPDLVLVDQRDALLDDPVGLQSLDAFPAWGRGQADKVADLGDRVGGILLEEGKDLAVDGVHGTGPRRGNKYEPLRFGRIILPLSAVF
jgi:hypothetical protein